MGDLGCATHRAAVVDRETAQIVVELDDITDLWWQRVLDNHSEAEVTVGRAGHCCSRLSDVRSWRHELAIWRGRNEVWRGPIMQTRYGATHTTLRARDRWAWLDVRDVRETLEVEGDHTQAALKLIDEALRHPDGFPDETEIRHFLDARPTGVWGSFEYKPHQRSVGAELRNLAQGPLNATFVGRSLVIFGPAPLSTTALLQDKDFLADLEVLEDGYSTATRVTVVGQGVVASCGGTDPYYGLIERTINDQTITSVEGARALACATQASNNYPPVVLSVPNGVQLAPTAPVTVDELVPGVEIPVWSKRTCRDINQALTLTQLEVRESPGNGEQVNVTVAPGTVLTGTNTGVFSG
ncbi:hypothetical protein ABT332_06505 [Saccharomonospora azurea]|uniref:hypothetical protein n=1 Tax=Saccharomonospora azurea TaxID=40988 RepID=UPI00331CAB48